MLKNNKMLKISLVIITILLALLVLEGNIFAGGSDPFAMPSSKSSPFSEWITGAGGIVLGVFQAVGTVIAVVILVWLGVKYIMASPDGKAEIKKQAFGYILGAVLLFGAVWIVPIIQSVVGSMQTPQ